MDKREFDSDPSVDRFDIVIKVKKNCLLFHVVPLNGYEPNYYEILGAMDAIKTNIIADQTDRNRKKFKAQKEVTK